MRPDAIKIAPARVMHVALDSFIPEIISCLSQHPELQLGSFGHPACVPGRIPDDLDVDLGNAGNRLHLRACVLFQHIAHSAARRGHGHLDLDPVATVGEQVRLAHVDEAQVHDVDRNLRVENRLERLDHLLQLEGPRFHRLFVRLFALEAKRVGILDGDPREIAPLGLDNKAAAQRLRQHDTVTLRKRHLLPARDERCLAVPREVDRCVQFKTHGCRSVETRSSLPSRALRSVCQARVAHLTRVGNSQTPDSTASLPTSSGFTSSFGPTVSRVWMWPKSASASSSFLPLRAVVMSEAEAFEMAQPSPWQAMSSMTPPASFT